MRVSASIQLQQIALYRLAYGGGGRGGNGLHHAKREGEFSGRRKCLGRMSRGNVLHSLAIAEVRVPSLLDISAAVTLD